MTQSDIATRWNTLSRCELLAISAFEILRTSTMKNGKNDRWIFGIKIISGYHNTERNMRFRSEYEIILIGMLSGIYNQYRICVTKST